MELHKQNEDNHVALCQECLLKLLKYFHSLCEKHNIKYTLEAGTLLGAVRHDHVARGCAVQDDLRT